MNALKPVFYSQHIIPFNCMFLADDDVGMFLTSSQDQSIRLSEVPALISKSGVKSNLYKAFGEVLTCFYKWNVTDSVISPISYR